MKDTRNYLLAGAIIIIALLTYCNDQKASALTENLLLQEAINDTLTTYKDKNGKMHSRIRVLTTTNTNNFLAIQSKDETINELQTLVKKNKRLLANSGSSATILHSNTNTNVSTTNVIVMGDSCNPTYTGQVHKRRDGLDWISGRISANKDSINLDSLNVLNKYNIVIGTEKEKGLFSKKKLYVDVTPLNPFSTITTVRTYQTGEKKKRWVLSAGISYGIGYSGLMPVLGIHVGYKLLEF